MARTDNPNYGPGSISTIAKGRRAAIQADIAKNTPKKASLLNAIMNPQSTTTPMSPSAQAINDRVTTEQALKKEVGGRR